MAMDWNEIGSLEDMKACRQAFLEDPGCDVDLGGIAAELEADGEDEATLLDWWFSAVLARFERRTVIPVHRHMTVPSFAAFADGLEAGTETAGLHWSLSPDTWSPAPYQSETDVLLSGEIDAAQVDWFTTFQNFFCHPWEEEVSFEGDVRLKLLRNLETGEERAPGRESYPTFRDEGFVPGCRAG